MRKEPRVTTRPAVSKQGQRDPGRRDRLVDVAVEVIAERGVAGATHRAVAEAAGVPLGSTTYYFKSLEDLHAEAITRHAANIFGVFQARLEGVRNREQLLDSLVDLVIEDLTGDKRGLVVTIELYALATRKAAFFDIADDWVRVTQALFELHMDEEAAQAVNALIEGIVIHSALSSTHITSQHLRRQLEQLVPNASFSPSRATVPSTPVSEQLVAARAAAQGQG
ncbi:DNA-binding transcriptional regulator YbjK [Rhodococcus koreensis]|uniref:DNA-binding transcriptional regulator YbjK n=1 Tax=Rhodococcus koreensis TaxID=99653 RepID=A0A1H4VLS5_9NOCA|nr:DNA-binding transcriptional regulator YbjK [Rhodococcus koreensis]